MKLFAAIALAAAALAGCGSGGDNGGSASKASGPTLYTFAKDSAGRSNCTGACAKNWPPAPSTLKPAGLGAGKLGTIERPDGTRQLALGSRPLYTFVGDKQPGDAKGDGVTAFGGVWTAATPAPAKPSRSYGY